MSLSTKEAREAIIFTVESEVVAALNLSLTQRLSKIGRFEIGSEA
jgi:hypothetical protein